MFDGILNPDIYLVTIQIFFVSFFVNLVWEVNHAPLYTTCLKMKFAPCVRLLTIMSLKDGFWITIFYTTTVIVFGEINIFLNIYQLLLFIILALTFSFFDERISINRGRWEYSPRMPVIFGVGLTPLLELAVTGIASMALVFYLF